MTGFLFCVAAVSLLPQDVVLEDRADVVEVNHYYDKHGELVFDQLILWRWCGADCDHRVFAWRIVKSSQQMPLRDYHRGGWVVLWQDQQEVRRVRADSFRRTWTQHDPELLDREHVQQGHRRGLSKRAPPHVRAK